VSVLLIDAVEEAQAVSRASGGAFDVTVGPLVRAWGFGAGAVETGAAPAPAELERLRESVGYRKLESRYRPPALRKSVATLHLDLDAIAPGLAVDQIAERLEALGVRDYLVELGGEVRARGAVRRAGRGAWRSRRRSRGSAAPCARRTRRMGVSTSGDYREFRDFAGAASRTRSIHARRRQ